VRSVEELDAFLGTRYVFVKDEVVSEIRLGSILIAFWLFFSDGSDGARLREGFLELLSGNFSRDELDEYVWLKVRFLVLDDWLIEGTAVLDLILLSWNMNIHKDGLSIQVFFHVESVDCFFGAFVIDKTNETGAGGLLVELDWVDLPELLEQLPKVLGGEICWHVVYIKVSELLDVVTPLSLFRVLQYFYFFSLDLNTILFLDSIVCLVLIFELNVTESSALSWLEYFEFARYNFSEFSKLSE